MVQSRPIRILMLLENESYPEDCRVLLQAQSLIQVGYQVTVVCPTSKSSKRWHEQLDNVRVLRYPQPPEVGGLIGYAVEYGYSILMQFFISLYVSLRYGFDGVHMHTPPDFNAIIPAFFRLFGKRFIYDLHDLSPELYQAQRDGKGNRFLHKTLLWFERFACRKADLLIATNETQREIQFGRGGADRKKCFVVRNGPNELFMGHVPAEPSLIKPSVLNIGYVGVIGVQDGVDYLVRAVDVLVKELQQTNFQVVIVGSGPAIKELKRLIAELQLGSYFHFTGMIPFVDVPRHIAAFDICSTPDPSNSYNDSCTTIKTMEYMAMQKPVVCFETAENIKTAGSAALYAKDNDVREYAKLLSRLMSDSDLRVQMGSAGRARVENGLTWNHQAQELIRGYNQLFGGQKDAKDN